MFAGIVQTIGQVVAVSRSGGTPLLSLDVGGLAGRLRPGDSLAVNGVCLTVERVLGGVARARVMPETLQRTNLGRLSPGARVNLEPALALGDPLGGHLVTGHVDGTGRVTRRWSEPGATWLEVLAPTDVSRYLVPKGAVAVDGASLTVARLRGARFAVSLVSFTLGHTILDTRRPGDMVNLEGDLMGKYILHRGGGPGP